MFKLLYLLFLIPVSFSFASENNQPFDASKVLMCTAIEPKLERLDCFDQVFNTPLPSVETLQKIKPESWSIGMALNEAKSNAIGSIYSSDPNSSEDDFWLVIPADDSSSVPSILMLSCIDNISRLEVLFYHKFDQSRVNVSSNVFSPSMWRFDDSGYVLSSPRGIAAVNMMKKMMTTKSLQLNTQTAAFKHLNFNTDGLSTALVPLRDKCSW